MIRLAFDRDVPLETRRELRGFATWLERELDVRDEVHVSFCWALAGYFESPKETPDRYQAVVTVGTGLGDALHTLAHELVHYEQTRADEKMHERGVNQRAGGLVGKWQRSRRARS